MLFLSASCADFPGRKTELRGPPPKCSRAPLLRGPRWACQSSALFPGAPRLGGSSRASSPLPHPSSTPETPRGLQSTWKQGQVLLGSPQALGPVRPCRPAHPRDPPPRAWGCWPLCPAPSCPQVPPPMPLSQKPAHPVRTPRVPPHRSHTAPPAPARDHPANCTVPPPCFICCTWVLQ